MKQIGVIILNWNGEQLLKEFIPAAAANCISEQSDLIVADNGSTDGSVAWIREHFPEIKLLELDRNYGFAEGYNLAIRHYSDYKYIVLLNSDVLTTPQWLDPLAAAMKADADVAAVQPKILSLTDRTSFEYAGAAGGFLDCLGYPFCRGRLFDSIEKDNGQYDEDVVEVCWASGAALMVRTERYLESGGLDPLFFAHMEEIDLCCRFIARGWKVCAVGKSAVYHLGGGSLPAGNPKKTYLNFRNNLLLLHKNLPPKIGKRKLLLRRLTDTLAFGMFCLKGDWANAHAVVKAHRDFRKMRRNYTDFPATDALSRLPGADKNILIEYYIKRKKKIEL